MKKESTRSKGEENERITENVEDGKGPEDDAYDPNDGEPSAEPPRKA